MKLPALCLAAFLLAGCVGVDGRTYVMLSTDQVHAWYVQGSLDFCLEDVAAELSRYQVPAISPVLTAAVAVCLEDAGRLLRERGVDVMPELLPQVVPNGDGKL